MGRNAKNYGRGHGHTYTFAAGREIHTRIINYRPKLLTTQLTGDGDKKMPPIVQH